MEQITPEGREALLSIVKTLKELIVNNQEKLKTIEAIYLLPGGQAIPIHTLRTNFNRLTRGYRGSLEVALHFINRDGPFTIVDDTFDIRMEDNDGHMLTYKNYTDAVEEALAWFTQQADTQAFVIRNAADEEVCTLHREVTWNE